MTEFILIRHGETAWNAEVRIQGHLDSPLNDEGLAQALLVGERLGRESFDHFYCSDLGRALQTAQPIADHSGKQPVREPRLRERHLGIFQGLTGPECEARFPEDYARFRQRDPDHAIPQGESIRQVHDRVAAWLTEMAARHAGGRIVAVTHGGVLDAAYRFVNRIALEKTRDFPVLNASVNCLQYDGKAWQVSAWGDISHLTRDAALDDF